jgi:GR25 family glycosyltransferase involved in LPS biosynthesis
MLSNDTWQIDTIPSFCITLERRADRWKRFQDQYGVKALTKLHRFLGIDGKKIDVRNDPRISLRTKRNILIKERRSHEELDSAGGVGCALSHIAVWEWMQKNNEPIALIFEDDAVVPPDFVSRANTLIRKSSILQNPNQWSIWLIGAQWDATEPLDPSIHLERAHAFFLLHCYVITKAFAKQLLDEVYPIEAHIDLWMSTFANIHNSRMIATKKLQLTQYGRTKTDIQVEKLPPICDIPTDYTKSHVLITKSDYALSRTAEAICVVLLGMVLIDQIKKIF